MKFGKRLMDVAVSVVGLLVLLPLLCIVALCIKIDSHGSVFYSQARVGKGGRHFQILKLRSMDAVSSALPAGITVSGDKRVTRVGKILRRYKIDELPQLWNVLVGDMSLVGPRPELPKYVETYSAEQRRVLSVLPGITDPATLVYRHEEEMLASCEDPEQVYRMRIMPDKLAGNLAYIQNISLRSDIRIIVETVGRSFFLVNQSSR